MAACEPPPGTDDGTWDVIWPPSLATCQVEGEVSGGRVGVRAEGGDFSVHLTSRARVRLAFSSSGGAAPAIDVRTAHLDFSGAGDEFPLHAATALFTQAGLVNLAAGTEIVSVVSDGDGVVLDAEPMPGYRVAGIRARCEQVAPGLGTRIARDDQLEAGLGVLGVATRLPLPIHLLPDDARVVTVTPPQDEGQYAPLYVELGPPEGLWRPARWSTESGEIRGWVRNEDATVPNTITGRGYGGLGCCGMRGLVGSVQTRLLPAETVLYARPGADPWARVHTPVEVEVDVQPDSRFARVLAIPDLAQGCDPENLWVGLEP